LVKEGKKAPNFTLQTDDETDVSVSDYQMKK
jgi:peroxiredoxin